MAFGTVKFMLGFMGDDQISGIITKSQKGLAGLGDSAKKGSRKAKGAFGEIHAALTSTTAKVARVGQAFTGVKSMVSTLGAGIKAAFAFIEEGEIAKQIDSMFGQLVKGSDAALSKLREATSELVDDTTLQANVNRMRFLGAGIDEITELLRVSSAVARVTQEDFVSLTKRFEMAVIGGRASSLKLLGVELDLVKALEIKADKIGKNVDELTREQAVSFKLQAVVETLNDQFAEHGMTLDSVAGSVSSLNTQYDNWLSDVSIGASDAFNSLAVFLGVIDEAKALGDVEALTSEFEQLLHKGRAMKAVGDNFMELFPVIQEFGDKVGLSSQQVAVLERHLISLTENEGDLGLAVKTASGMILRAKLEQKAATIALAGEQRKQRIEERASYDEYAAHVEKTKDWMLGVQKAAIAAEKAKTAKGKAAAARVAAVKSETAGLIVTNRLREMELAGATKLEIADRKRADTYAETAKLRTKYDFQRENKAKKEHEAELEYLKVFGEALDAGTKAKEEADAAAAEAADKVRESNAKLRDDWDRLALDAEADRVDRLSASMLGFGQHVEGAAMSVSSSAPAIAGAFGSIGAVVGIMGDNVGDFAAGVPKSLSALGAITASTTQNVKTQATIQSAFEYAAAIAAGARLDFWGASQHALAGTMFAAVAGTAGGGKKSAGTSAGGGLGAGGLASGGAGSALSSSMASSVTVNVQGLMSGTSADLGVALGESLSDVKTTGLGSRSV